MDWSPLQEQALSRVSRWLDERSAPWFYLAGYAGTGKTTLARHFAESVKGGDVLFGAFTGKAALVMRQKGCEGARTLHSWLYTPSERARVKLIHMEGDLAKLIATPAPLPDTLQGRIHQLTRDIEALRKTLNSPGFDLNPESAVKDAALVVLDECSMVDERLARDVLSFNVPVLVLGDPAQLPPVRGAGFFTSRQPDFILTEVHRQALDSPILKLATEIRNGAGLHYLADGDARVVPRGAMSLTDLACAEQVLAGKNDTRRKIIAALRGAKGFDGPYPLAGERLVCLRNNREHGLLNGLICEMLEDADDDGEGTAFAGGISVLDEDNVLPYLRMARWHFDAHLNGGGHVPPYWERDGIDEFDFGYCLTVHKSQGSQWDDVVLIDDGFGRTEMDRRRWLYTGVTRAARTLTVITRDAAR